MKISTKGRYAVRLMLDLAVYNTGEPISLKDVAVRQNISEKYLEQIIGVLHRSGYVRSVRGAGGGYLLTKDPSEYTVGDILRLTEGDLVPVGCVGMNPEPCERESMCVTVEIWQKIYDAISQVVDNITLEYLVNRFHEKGSDYVI